MFDLKGKIAWVTGASYGIGFAIANALAGAGAKIVFNDINQELVDKGLAAYNERGIEAYGFVCDVTDENAVNEAVKKIEQDVGVVEFWLIMRVLSTYSHVRNVRTGMETGF